MPYRRTDVKGALIFFTVNLAERNKTLLIDEFDILRAVINKVKKQLSFYLDPMVILPDHRHVLMTLPKNDNDFAK